MNKRDVFYQKLNKAREMLHYRENLFPENRSNPILQHFRSQMDLAEKIANKATKHTRHLDEMTMGHTAVREIQDMDPDFSKAVTELQYSLKQLMGVDV